MSSSFFSAKTQTLTLPDGRILSFGVFGAGRDTEPGTENLPVVFYFHGVPSSHDEAYMMHNAALERGIQIVALDRPGYAGSTPQPGRQFLDWPSDVLAVADHFSIPRFAIIGASGGGPYALACLRSLPKDRLTGVALCSSVYPVSFGLAGMKFLNILLLRIAPWVPSLLAWIVDYTQSSAARDEEHPEVYVSKMMEMMKSIPAADRVVFYDNIGGYRGAIVAGSREALKPGGQTFAQEYALLGSDWGYKIEEIQDADRLFIWHGTEDIHVPIAMAEKASQLLPNAELRRLGGEGHVGPVLRASEILDVTKSKLGRSVQ
ncbi:AB hydrolase-1 domain-containing protein [Fusarium keratoplasticum]|uniref:AB hydrolase-1 domain-containing protein n=1 Tax=Fusarium keratoplasticum TaxID=1328300 RepID=A0ACC0QC57_9HYPO|nr:AB hydrolase-1 domain-containing protein [Fusarium keratoplasticum]KAI8650256.1 AB hydrolase-1 domain-containing protein [Fusarium keratoplasticum]